jgi:hypothetical protein
MMNRQKNKTTIHAIGDIFTQTQACYLLSLSKYMNSTVDLLTQTQSLLKECDTGCSQLAFVLPCSSCKLSCQLAFEDQLAVLLP